MVRVFVTLATTLAVLSGVADACSWTGCRNSNPNCPQETGIPDSYYSGRTTRSGWAWDWNFCGWAWEEKYECCWTPRPTNYPTPKPTPFPTNFPTPYPTLHPTLDPTAYPSVSPTTPKPTVNPTVSPTPPTPFPTKAPTIAVPSAAPTVPLDLCDQIDIDVFQANRRNFDKDLTICGVYCSLDVLRDPEEIIGCMKKCHSDDVGVRRPTLRMPPFQPNCAFCFGRYAECMLNTCDCYAGRPMSQECTDCSLSTCEAPFTNCTGGMVIDKYTDGFPVPEVDDNTLMVAALGAFGGLVMLSGAAGLYMYRQRVTRDPGRASSLRLSTFLGKSPIATKVVASSNPLHSGPAVTATALGGVSAEQAAAAAVAATVAAAAVASAGAKITVVHSFEGNPDYDDELTVGEGDELEFVELVGDDHAWMSCVDPRTGKEGIIPTVNVKFA